MSTSWGSSPVRGSRLVQGGVYLDYQASTPLDPRVRLAMAAAYDVPGNPSSEEHGFGWAAARKVEDARGLVADVLNASSEEITFTSGATEANNIAILGAAMGAPASRRRILISSIEHKSVSGAAYGAERLGFKVELVAVTPDGVVDLQSLAALLADDVAVVSVMAVSNEIGTVQPTEEVGRLVRLAGAFFHVDATQGLAAEAVDVGTWKADAVSLSGHKIYGPGGIGALFVGLDAPWRPMPLMHGGDQERGLRPGTVPVPLCVGLGEACRLISTEGEGERERVLSLREALKNRLEAIVPGLIVTCEKSLRHPGCLHVRLPGIPADDLILRLQPRLAVSSGSACTSGVIGPSFVSLAVGMTAEEASECLRFSVGRFSSGDDLEQAASLIEEALRSRLS